MKSRVLAAIFLGTIAQIALPGTLAAASPIPVSPGGSGGGVVEDRCPTFSWAGTVGAEGFELIVYAVGAESRTESPDAPPALSVVLPAGARSWTPDSGHCLEVGGRYAWSLRAVTEDGRGGWSEPALFEVGSGPSAGEVEAALATLRRFLAGPATEREGGVGARRPASSLETGARPDRGGERPGAIRDPERRGSGGDPLPSSTAGPSLLGKMAPGPGSPSLVVSDPIHLGPDSALFQDGDLLLWSDGASYDLGVGFQALESLGSAFNNTAVGTRALANATGGSTNTGIGAMALFNTTTGHGNVASGAFALVSNTTGIGNVAVGRDALSNVTTGSNNIALGAGAGEGLNYPAGPFPHDDNIFIGNDGLGELLSSGVIRIGEDGIHSHASIAGKLGLGTPYAATRLDVLRAVSGLASPENHVARIYNTSGAGSADVLALQIAEEASDPSPEIGGNNNFISFFDEDGDSLGSIQGNGSGGIELGGPGQDYAEWLPRLVPEEAIRAGDVVGVFAGRISRETEGADAVMVVSRAPIVAGGDPGEGEREGYEKVAFVGQVPVKVRGRVARGDLIVPSGDADGLGVAFAPSRLPVERLSQVVGQAWEGSDSGGVREVRVLVGLVRPAALSGVVARLEGAVGRMERQLGAERQARRVLEKRLELLETGEGARRRRP